MATDTNDALIHTAQPLDQPTLLGLDAEGWVYVGLTIFLLIAIFVAKAPKRIAAILDQRIVDTRKSLDEAKALRDEAEALLAEAKRQQAAAHKDAEGIIAHARTEAAQMIDQARSDADTLVERRHKMAEDRIAAAERMAIADVRAKAATAATAAAAALIAQHHDAQADKALVDGTIANLN
jgi:F-type H+-transporting ATPase subunit b